MKEPQEIEALADRIDHEQLWRRSWTERADMSQEQRDRLDAAVHLRRYAHDRFTVLEELKKGAEFIRGYKLERESCATDARGCGSHEWHVAINKHSDECRAAGERWPSFMYTAKMIADEVPRMILLFETERAGKLPARFKLCDHEPGPGKPLLDNHLRCALGKACRKCPHLQAIDANERMSDEAKDEAKAWTCATHILLESKPDTYFEGFLHDKSDDAFHARMARSFADAEPPEPPMVPPDSWEGER